MTARRTTHLVALLLIAGLAAAILTSCGAVSLMDTGEVRVSREIGDDRYYPAPQEYDAVMEEPYDPAVKRINGGAGDYAIRHVIRTGSIDLTVRDTRETIPAVREIAAQAEGFISSSHVYEIREGLYGANLTLRIPERRFDAVMEQLEALGKAANLRTGADDVTMQYIDLESRLNNQIAQENRLVEILALAETVEEVLEVERELFRVRGEIESMTTQLNYLQDQVAYSTITVSLREETIPTENIAPGVFDNLGSRIMQALIGSINFVLNSFSFIVVAFFALLPIVALLGLLAVLIWLLVKKVAKRKKAVPGDSKEG